jgi:hypothetical protein
MLKKMWMVKVIGGVEKGLIAEANAACRKKWHRLLQCQFIIEFIIDFFYIFMIILANRFRDLAFNVY